LLAYNADAVCSDISTEIVIDQVVFNTTRITSVLLAAKSELISGQSAAILLAFQWNRVTQNLFDSGKHLRPNKAFAIDEVRSTVVLLLHVQPTLS